MRFKLLLYPFLFILFFSCTPKEADNKDSPSPETPKESPSKETEGSVLTLIKSQSETDKDSEKSKKGEQEIEEQIDWDTFTGPLHLQSIKPTSYHLPESLMIGPLSDPLSYTLAEREAYSLVTQFWNSYRKGRIPRELLSSEVHPLFLSEMEEFLGKGGEVIALYPGSFQLSGLSASVKIVLLSETGYIKALMFMEKEDDLWTLQDWEIPFREWPGETVPREKDLLQTRTVY